MADQLPCKACGNYDVLCDDFAMHYKEQIAELQAEVKRLQAELHDARTDRTRSDQDAKEAQSTAISLRAEVEELTDALEIQKGISEGYKHFIEERDVQIASLKSWKESMGKPYVYSDTDEYQGETLDAYAREAGHVIGDEFQVIECYGRELWCRVVGGGYVDGKDTPLEFHIEAVPPAPPEGVHNPIKAPPGMYMDSGEFISAEELNESGQEGGKQS